MTPFTLYPPHEAGQVPFREHPGEEFLFIHEGRAELLLPSRAIELGVGDSVYFKATTPHKVRSLSAGRAVVLLLVCDDGTEPNSRHPHLP